MLSSLPQAEPAEKVTKTPEPRELEPPTPIEDSYREIFASNPLARKVRGTPPEPAAVQSLRCTHGGGSV